MHEFRSGLWPLKKLRVVLNDCGRVPSLRAPLPPSPPQPSSSDLEIVKIVYRENKRQQELIPPPSTPQPSTSSFTPDLEIVKIVHPSSTWQAQREQERERRRVWQRNNPEKVREYKRKHKEKKKRQQELLSPSSTSSMYANLSEVEKSRMY